MNHEAWTRWILTLAIGVAAAADATAAPWTKRLGDAQNSSNAGVIAALTEASVPDLRVVAMVPTDGIVNGSPTIEDGLLMVGDGGVDGRFLYVADLENDGKILVKYDTGAIEDTLTIGQGMQSTPTVARVTVPDGAGGTRESWRVYFGANVKPKSFFCLDLDRIAADRGTLEADPGTSYVCEGADWPIIIAGIGNISANDDSSPYPVYHGAPLFAADQSVRVGHDLEVRDVIYTPTIGADCSDGQLWAIDAHTAELLWAYDPVPNYQSLVTGPRLAGPGYGGNIWTVPAMSRDRKTVYVTTGDCLAQPQIGFQAESIVALDATEGVVQWWHQRRLVDAADFDVGNSPMVVDVEGENGCHHVVSTDKNGCVYAFRQTGDIPQTAREGFDPLRPGQQRVVWRTCLVRGGITGGFNATGPAFHDRWVFAQANPAGNMPGDNANAFALDACTGELAWATADVSKSQTDAAIASGLLFQLSGSVMQVMRASDQYALLATVELGVAGSPGGGGPSIVGDTIYVPTREGVAIVQVDSGSGASAPKPGPAVAYAGPYPIPLGGSPDQVMPPADPYDPESALAPAVAEWPTMQAP